MPSLVDKRLGQLPQKLAISYDELYSKKVEFYEAEEKAVLDACICWLLATECPLETSGFVAAVSATVGHNTDVSRETILDLCFNLVIIDKALDVFRFAHLSVREFLETKSAYEVSQAHATIAKGCLSLLIANTDLVTRIRLLSRPSSYCFDDYVHGMRSIIDRYACLTWSDHFQLAGAKTHAKPTLDAFFEFCGNGYLHWAQAMNALHKPVDRLGIDGYIRSTDDFLSRFLLRGGNCEANPIFTAAALGIWEIFELKAYKDLTCVNRYRCGPLTVACYFRQIETVQWMLNHGADPDEQHGPFDDFPLAVAVASGNYRLTQLLLERGAHVNSRTGENGRAFCLAIARNDLKIARLLLDNGADVELDNLYILHGNIRHRAWKAPLFYADRKETIEFLLQRGASPHRKDRGGFNVLEDAIFLGHRRQFDLWIDQAVFDLDESLLPLAIHSLNLDLVGHMLQRLLDNNAKIDLERCRQRLLREHDYAYRRWIIETTFLEHELRFDCRRYHGTRDLLCDRCSELTRSGAYMRKFFS